MTERGREDNIFFNKTKSAIYDEIEQVGEPLAADFSAEGGQGNAGASRQVEERAACQAKTNPSGKRPELKYKILKLWEQFSERKRRQS